MCVPAAARDKYVNGDGHDLIHDRTGTGAGPRIASCGCGPFRPSGLRLRSPGRPLGLFLCPPPPRCPAAEVMLEYPQSLGQGGIIALTSPPAVVPTPTGVS
jgi:hypothetical protein